MKNRVIILAAGQAFMLDGLVKCLIRAPHDGAPLLSRYIQAFPQHEITVVVGYRAVSIMQLYPNLNYVFNPNWASTNSSYSLGLALDERPTYVVSGDLVFEPDLINEMEKSGPNLILTENRENRILTSVHCSIEANTVRELYVGPIRKNTDPEAMGVFKVSDPSLLQQWRKNCLRHGNLPVGLNLPTDGDFLQSHPVGQHLFYELNEPMDYLRALEQYRATP